MTECRGDEMVCGEKCVSLERFCDGHVDCPSGQDEPAGCGMISVNML